MKLLLLGILYAENFRRNRKQQTNVCSPFPTFLRRHHIVEILK